MENDSFRARLQTRADDMEARLAEALAETASGAGTAPDRLVAAMRHGLLGGGKRLRPFLVAETAAMFGVPAPQALAVGAAVECVHSYSLVHDDLPAMDNDETRRGRPTVWRAFDDWTAILAGDALLTLAFEILADPRTGIAPETRCRLVTALAQASGWQGMVGGQCLDLEAEKLKPATRATEADVRRLQAMKTGALLRFSVEAGALLGNANGGEHAALRSYGADLGLAFQIADDLLDAEGDAEALGKAVGKDAALGKATLVGLNGIEAARAELVSVHGRANAALAPFGERARWLKAAADFVVGRDH